MGLLALPAFVKKVEETLKVAADEPLIGQSRFPNEDSTPEQIVIHELSVMLGGRVSAAKALGCSPQQVMFWLSPHESPPDDAVSTARALLEVGLAFREIWKASLYVDWLFTDNVHLGNGRPVDVIASGGKDDAVSAIEAAAYGEYA
jgi:hypothetical protein